MRGKQAIQPAIEKLYRLSLAMREAERQAFIVEVNRKLNELILQAAEYTADSNRENGEPIMNLKDELNKINAHRRAIRLNSDLSDEGKEKQLAILDKRQEQMLAAAWREYNVELKRLRKELKDLSVKRAEAEEQAAKRWSYDRLVYNRAVVENVINRAVSLNDVEAAYRQAAQGDRHLRRAWAEFAPGIVEARFAGAGVAQRGDLLRAMRADLQELLTTPELRDLADQEDRLTRQLVDVVQQVEVGAETIGRNAFVRNEFERLLEGISVTTKVDSQTLGMSYQVDLA